MRVLPAHIFASPTRDVIIPGAPAPADGQAGPVVATTAEEIEQKYISVFEADRKEQKLPIADINDIYQHADRLKAAVGMYAK